MESESDAEAAMLAEVDAIRARAERMPRGHAILQLAHAVLLAAYLGVVVFTGSIEGGGSVLGGSTMLLVLPPVIISTGLVYGATERFRERLHAAGRQWIAVGVLLAALVGLSIWGIAGPGYPWWIALVAAAVTLVVLGARPLAIVLRARGARSPARSAALAASAAAAVSGNARMLSAPARITTSLLGVLLGAVCAAVLVPTVEWTVSVLGTLAALVALAAHDAPWGLLRVGYDWRAPQWCAFGLAALVMFALAVRMTAVESPAPALVLGAGALVAALLVGAAFIRGRDRVASEA